jgi:glycosyltransferase involved in cell wall biosynthesis
MVNDNPIVSVIIPTYNREKLLPRAIKSVLSQTFQDFELIIVDDGSNDNTKEVVEKFKKKDNRVKYFYQKNSGPARARNLGIKNSKGDYIAFLDSDDEWLSEKLEKQIKIIKKSRKEVGCFFSNGIIKNSYTGEDDFIKEFPCNIFSRKKNTLKFFLKLKGINACSNMVLKKEVFNKCGLFDSNLPVLEDPELLIRIANNFSFHHMEDVLYIRKINKTSLHKTINISKRINAMIYILEKHTDLYEQNKEEKMELFRKILNNSIAQKEARKFFYFFIIFLIHSKINKTYIKTSLKYILAFSGFYYLKAILKN